MCDISISMYIIRAICAVRAIPDSSMPLWLNALKALNALSELLRYMYFKSPPCCVYTAGWAFGFLRAVRFSRTHFWSKIFETSSIDSFLLCV